MTDDGFVQDPAYAGHFGAYRGLLARLLDHDPAMFELDKSLQLVDAGCGYGDLLKTLRARGYSKLIGVEPDSVCRAAAQKEGFAVRPGTLRETGLPSGFADAVIVNEVFHHVDDYDAAVDELARIIKPAGFLCFLEPAPTYLRRGMDFLTFRTPLPKWVKPVRARYEVMRLEVETGLYPKFLSGQAGFHGALKRRFSPLWLHRCWFFQFGKFTRRT